MSNDIKSKIELMTNMSRESLESVIDKMPINEMAELYRHITDMKDEADRKSTEVGKLWDVFRKTFLPNKMEDLGVSSVNMPGIGRLSLATDAYCSVPSGQKEALFEWLREHDHADIIQPVVNSSTLKAFMKEQILEGNEVPDPDVVSFQPYTYAKLTKS